MFDGLDPELGPSAELLAITREEFGAESDEEATFALYYVAAEIELFANLTGLPAEAVFAMLGDETIAAGVMFGINEYREAKAVVARHEAGECSCSHDEGPELDLTAILG